MPLTTTQLILEGNSNMASTLRPRPHSSNLPPRPLSANFIHHSKDASMIFSLLPSAVKSRLPRMPSLRRSVSKYGSTRRKSTGSTSGTTTPDTGYTSAMVLSEGSRALMTTTGDEMAEYYIEGMSSDEETQQPTTGKTQRPRQISEAQSGIVWKFANQGLNLLSIAVDESSTITQDPQTGNAPFARQLYIHALTYLLRALPADLTTEEQMSVRSALPVGVVEPLQIGLNAGSGQIQGSAPVANAEPSLLHRTLASTIIQFFLFVQFLLPYLRYLLSSAYQYDREHKITEKIFSQSIETVDSLGKGGVSLTAAIYNMGDGKVGQVITDTASWLVEGVTGGIHDGVGEAWLLWVLEDLRMTAPLNEDEYTCRALILSLTIDTGLIF